MCEQEIKCYTLKDYNRLDRALFQNIDYGDQEFAESLIEQGANIQGFALIVAIQAGELEMTQRLVELGSDINVRYDPKIKALKDTTPLIRAITATQIPILRFLLASGADPYLADSTGCLPIDAARHGELRLGTTEAQRQEMIDLLEQYMASYKPKST